MQQMQYMLDFKGGGQEEGLFQATIRYRYQRQTIRPTPNSIPRIAFPPDAFRQDERRHPQSPKGGVNSGKAAKEKRVFFILLRKSLRPKGQQSKSLHSLLSCSSGSRGRATRVRGEEKSWTHPITAGDSGGAHRPPGFASCGRGEPTAALPPIASS